MLNPSGSQPDPEKLLTESAAARYLSVSLSTIRRWRHARVGPRHLQVGSIIRYPLDSLREFIDRHCKSD